MIDFIIYSTTMISIWAELGLSLNLQFGLTGLVNFGQVLPFAIGAYGAILKERGEPLHYPGGTPNVFDGVDADLVGRAIRWAGEAEAARNQAFNITNGDVMVWRNVWPAIATITFGVGVWALAVSTRPPVTSR